MVQNREYIRKHLTGRTASGAFMWSAKPFADAHRVHVIAFDKAEDKP